MPAVSFDHIDKSFGAVHALRDVSFSIDAGEAHAIVGENGAGKSTLLKILAGEHPPDRGALRLDGHAVTLASPRDALARGIGLVHQEMLLFPNLSVTGNIFAGRELTGRFGALREGAMRERARALLKLVGLDADQFAERKPRELSGGQRQRIGVARALAADPPFILLDEPFGALDPITRREIQREFKTLQRELRKTMIFVTHDIAEAFLLANRIALLKDGAMIFLGPPEELLRSQDPEARAFAEGFSNAQIAGSPA